MIDHQNNIIVTIKKVLKDDIIPFIALHGGSVKFIKFVAGTVYVKFSGACISCPISMYTLKYGIEEKLKNKIPEVKLVKDIDEES